MALCLDIEYMKPILILLHGTSLKEFEERIEDFRDFDVIWASMNFYWQTEAILQKIGKSLDMVICLDEDILVRFSKEMDDFKRRGEFISRERFTHYEGNTIFCFLMYLIRNGFKEIFLFGADGYSDEKDFYYKQEQRQEGISSGRNQELKENTEYLNDNFPKDIGDVKIYNVSPNSHYEPFKKISYDECISLLKEK